MIAPLLNWSDLIIDIWLFGPVDHVLKISVQAINEVNIINIWKS